MKKSEYALAILLVGGLWGISEAVLGDVLYTRKVPFASVYLTAIGFFLLAVSRAFLRWTGAATAIAGLAMLYKLLNVPFFGCHLTGILLLGIAWDVMFFRSRPERTREGAARLSLALSAGRAAAAVYLGHVLFVAAMLFVFRSEHWVERGAQGWLRHVGLVGTITAATCAVIVPFGLLVGERLRRRSPLPLALPAWSGTAASIALTAALWIYSVAGRLLRA